jgi:hypothetical protein
LNKITTLHPIWMCFLSSTSPDLLFFLIIH